jgi:chromosome partitioning protein
MGVIIAVANQKGGVGKTTTTANLGATLAARGYRVLLVDMDPQGNLTLAFGKAVQEGPTVADALLDRKVRLPIVCIQEKGVPELDLVPASLDLATAEAALMNKLGREQRLRDQLGTAPDHYDFVLIDTPPSLGLLTINALVAAQKVIIPSETRFFSVRGLEMLLESIDEVLYLNPRLTLMGIVLSKHDRRLKEERTVEGYLRETYGDQVFRTIITANSKILQSASVGVSILSYAGADRAVSAYQELAQEVAARV